MMRKVIPVFTLCLLFITVFVSFGLTETSAESGFLRCYNRKIQYPQIDCSKCDDLDGATLESRRTTCSTFDTATCTCPSGSTSCDRFDNKLELETEAVACYEGGGFWNDNYCECLKGDGSGIIEGLDADRDINDSLFFTTNWDGRVENIPEMIRFVLIVVFAAFGSVAFFIGLWGMATYTMAREDDEAIQKGQSIFKNGLMGLLIAVFAIAFIQFLAYMFGVDWQDLFKFDFK